MQEDFLHYIWKYKKFTTTHLQTTNYEVVTLLTVGSHNHNTGPDFFNAQLKINEQLWAGNVEIHVKSSDWFLHNHETDANYDNVILHVVWEHDTPIFRKDNTEIPTLELKEYVSAKALTNYNALFNSTPTWINCEAKFPQTEDFILEHWLERLYIERLERKSLEIEAMLKHSKNDWEAVLFKLLTKNFGLKVNKEAFLSIAESIEFSIIRKLQSHPIQLEALLLGQANLLTEAIEDAYYVELNREYTFLKQKFNLNNSHITPIQFFRLRPSNFPTIRLSQLASVYTQNQNLFSQIINTETLEDFYKLFTVKTSAFWESHYTFSKTSKFQIKTTTKSFIELLLINTILPIKFSYAKYNGKSINDSILNLLRAVKPENNSIVNKFNTLKPINHSALQSQALLELKTNYCDKNKCLECAIGSTILTGNV
ncbi:DUF2851 family protein [Lacinutrix salivirga]